MAKSIFQGYIAAIAFNKASTTVECMVNTQYGTKVLRHKIGSLTGLSVEESKQLWKELHAAMRDQDRVHFFQREGAKAWGTYFDSMMVEQVVTEDDLSAFTA